MIALAGIIVLGILAQWVAWRLRLPAILPLILIGLLVGPIAEIWTGHKFIEPVFDYLFEANGKELLLDEHGNPQGNGGLFPSDVLFWFVSLAIGVILFEGGLTLNRHEVTGVGPAIGKLVTLGSAITFIGAGLAAKFIIGLPYDIAFLFGSLVIVTGPTVIAPILRNVPLRRNISTVLKWEGILIDPIGALVAVLVFDFIISHESEGSFGIEAFKEFMGIISVGFTFGIGTGFSFYQLLKRDMIPHYLLNVVSLALVLGAFALSDIVVHESGLLTVVVMGMTLANLKVPHFKELLYFKESLTVLLISILFIVLSANIDGEQLLLLADWRYWALFAVVVLVLRPLSVFASTAKGGLDLREKLFISWVGPRGIVAAGIASLFGLKLANYGYEEAELITPLVFMIVMGTVLLNATTARLVAKLLGVTLQQSNGLLIVGANPGARLIANYLQNHGRHVVLVDRSPTLVQEAQDMGLKAIEQDIIEGNLEEELELLDMGYLLALTPSTAVNEVACKRYKEVFGENGTFRIVSQAESQGQTELADEAAFDIKTDYINFLETARDYPHIREHALESQEQFEQICQLSCRNTIPLFILKPDGNFHFVRANQPQNEQIEAGDTLIYMGKEIEAPTTEMVEELEEA
ncbi:cation:proton antiporter [Saprospira sp. CCB-QB6]|uniref:cation:proton antiporter n=1 Tax=Saprospira sp. CCB-QB6 TaxID=3023936 RepID=UPI00234BA4E5|nr:sodium:proton antiporter [Saprospira sp. CCB-QB6]WCL80473.1 cation:proton antiporter [Saprospira sp. CCB-QB6]